jgi:tetratricopeptide (TPR) repeat protein
VARLLSGVALQIWIFGFIVFFGAEVVLLEPQLRVVAQLLYCVPLIAWALLRVRRRLDRLDIAVMVGLGLYLLVALFSRDRTGSLETLALVSLYALLFWVVRDAAASPTLREWIAVGIGTAMAFSLALNALLLIREKVAWISATGTMPQLEGREVFPWETVNVLPVLVLIALPFIFWMPSGRYRWFVLGVIGLSALVVVPFSNGRAGFLGLSVALGTLVLLSVAPRQWFRSRPVWVQRAAGIGLGVVGVFVAVRGWQPFVHAITSSGRGDLYEASVQMFADRPIFGNGPSTYSWARFLYGTEPARVLAVRRTHGVPLQTVVDGGLGLAVALLGVLATWMRSAFSSSLSLPRRVSIAALVGFAAAVLFDDFSFLPSVTAMVICLAVFALPSPMAMAASRHRLRAWIPVTVGGIALLLALPFAVQADRARLAAGAGRQAAVMGDWNAAAGDFGTATTAHPENGGYWLGLAKSRSELGQLEAARAAYDQARIVNPGEARAYGGLAALTDDREERIDLLRRASDTTAGDPQYAYRLGIELIGAGDSEGAAEAWGRAVDLRSTAFGILPYDQYGISRVAVAKAAVAHTYAATRPDENVDPDARWDVALSLDELPADAGLAWRAVDAARHGHPDEGRRLAQAAATESAYFARSYEALEAVSAFACNADERERALAQESATRDAYGPSAPAVAIHREFVYREASLGAAQPPNVARMPYPERWPWSLITERPSC